MIFKCEGTFKSMIDAGLKLDGYGACFDRPVDKSPWGGTKLGNGLISKYKFYLAFENALHCNDYISEKFWRNSLGTGAVPLRVEIFFINVEILMACLEIEI